MVTKQDIQQFTARYLEDFVQDQARTEQFLGFLEKNKEHQLFIRSNFDGHITASSFVINTEGTKMLLLYHKFLDKWLQPGGHVDNDDDSIRAAALRETTEETGIMPVDLQIISKHADSDIPFDVDTHFIPQNIKKQEDEHFHHDFRYLFRYLSHSSITIDFEESNDFQWIDLKELETSKDFRRVVEKIRFYLTQGY